VELKLAFAVRCGCDFRQFFGALDDSLQRLHNRLAADVNGKRIDVTVHDFGGDVVDKGLNLGFVDVGG